MKMRVLLRCLMLLAGSARAESDSPVYSNLATVFDSEEEICAYFDA